MSKHVGFLMLVLCACGADRGFRVENTTGQTARASGCGTDDDCGPGLLCEACGDGFKTCVPGCREDAQCGPNMICVHDVECLSCPCPSGWCDLDPCRDLDGDGYAAALEGECPGKLIGDCNDALASVNPGGRERCNNGQDDDCNGKKDSADPACRSDCTQGFAMCATSRWCRSHQWCDRGCCEPCPTVTVPTCDGGTGYLTGGLDALGCAAPLVCVDASACANERYEPVCGRNFATYDNACQAGLVGTRVLHTGNCAYREGDPCMGSEDCAYNTFCRNMAEDGGEELRCAQRGTCSVDADCAYAPGVIPCGDGGVAKFRCEAEQCIGRCG